MSTYKVAPVPGYEDQILEEYARLSLPCADGFYNMIRILEHNEPGLNDRCGLIDDRFELYAIPLPDCVKRAMIVTVDRKRTAMPRAIHGTVPRSSRACDRGAKLAIRQLGLVDPSWEIKS